MSDSTEKPQEVFAQVSSSAAWNVVRWKGGRVIQAACGSSVARHLYRGNVWHGIMSGMTDDTEELILNALNPKISDPK